MADRITTDQLLNLADRAERNGGLSAAEAARLRTGLAKLYSDRQDLQNRLRAQSRRYNAAASELRCIHRLVRHAQRRGSVTIPTWALDAYLSVKVYREAA